MKTQNNVELNTILMNSVYKIEGKSMDDPTKIVRGTGFIIGKRDSDTSQMALIVLVTAKHVLDDIGGEFAYLKLRYKNTDTSYNEFVQQIRIRNENEKCWYIDEDQSIDIAALPISLPEKFLEYFGNYFLSDELLATDSAISLLELHPGDEVFSIGFPLGIGSNYFGFPLLRSGKIASYPLLPTSTYKTMLIDMNVFEGNSGSPVYICENSRIIQNNKIVFEVIAILGVLTTSIKQISYIEYQNMSIEEKIPLGLGGVVPSSYLLKILQKIETDTDIK